MPPTATTDGTEGSVPTRLLPHRPFPPYTHIPGVTPHPIGDPAGHSFGRTEAHCDPPDPSAWRACEPYLWGVDLFNAGYYWEAHEAWESAWIAAGRRGPTADFLKALIKLAAAGVKLRERNAAGARRHLRRAVELLAAVAVRPGSRTERMFGLAVLPLRAWSEQRLWGSLPADQPADGRPVSVFGTCLLPE